MNPAPYRYCVYGLSVVSDAPLALPAYVDSGLGEVECRSAPASAFRAAADSAAFDSRSASWYQYARLADGSSYVRWDAIGEFLVTPDGGCITSHRAAASSI